MSEVILHITPLFVQVRIEIGDFAEDLRFVLGQNIGQYVQTTAVGHAHDDLFDSLIARLFNRHVQQGNQAFGTFQRKGLGRLELGPQKIFERRGVGQASQNTELGGMTELNAVLGLLHPILQPLTFGNVIDMHELHTNVTAVGRLQSLQQFAQCQIVGTAHADGRIPAVHVGVGKPEVLGVQMLLVAPGFAGCRSLAQGINLGKQVPPHPVVADQLRHLFLANGHFHIVGRGAAIGTRVTVTVGLSVARSKERRRGEGRTDLGSRRGAIAVQHLAKIGLPFRRDRLRIPNIVGIQVFNEGQIITTSEHCFVRHEWQGGMVGRTSRRESRRARNTPQQGARSP